MEETERERVVMGDEKLLGMIPRVACRQVNYAVFVSDKRVVLIKTGWDMTAIGGVLGGVLGAYLAHKRSIDQLDFGDLDLDGLVDNSDYAIQIPLDKIAEIRLKKEIGVFRIIIFGYNKRNKKKKLINCFLAPPQQVLDERVKSGEKPGDVMWEYALMHQDMIERVFGDRLTLKYR